MDRFSTPIDASVMAKVKPLVVCLVGLLVLAGCGSDGETANNPPRQISTVAALVADLAPRLQDEFGPAVLRCGSSDFFSGGTAGGELQSGNGINCLYMSGLDQEQDGKDPLIVGIVALVTSPDTYSYTANSLAGPNANERPTPEWTYRDGLNCNQLTEPVTSDTAPGPSFSGIGNGNLPGLSYANVVYYWYDTGEPEAMDPDGDGRPCTDQFPEADVAQVFDETLPLPKVSADTVALSDPLSTFAIRKSLEDELTNDQTTQLDCDLAGPVGVGSYFTCAPRFNGEPDLRMVAVINAEGEFLVGHSSTEYRESGDPNFTYYRPGLTCAQLAAPLTDETIATGASMSDLPKKLTNDGLGYEEAVLYSYLYKSQNEFPLDSQGWPCGDVYPADEVDSVQSGLRTAD